MPSSGAVTAFAYTVGLFGIGHPELIVFGLDAESAYGTLYWFFDEVKRGRVLAPDEIVSPPGSDTRFLVERFPNPGSVVFAANRFHGRSRRSSVPCTSSRGMSLGRSPGRRATGTRQRCSPGRAISSNGWVRGSSGWGRGP
ncbi:DUF4262 domain-containing protein [Tessaracoccus defluvii]|uniref:DUF4262 domain-containing protein n=1 Tax=Tessaracoccus defluvii TaxID=1285901 RepID=A0A7H0H242_9ACTN|nr:DUF4262 domain-containing protein [Tessaracoccus defluvii]QNP54608.1 DUF4262 domain-containing protein [Tessaracoccus defluvii]